MLCHVYAAYRRSLLRVRSMARCELTFSSCSCAILTVAGRGMLDCTKIVVLQSIALELLYASKTPFL